MKKAFLLLLFLIGLAIPAMAQQGNTITIRFAGAPTGTCPSLGFGINSATGDLYDCVGTTWTKVGTGGGGGTPGGATGTIQYNAGAGAFGGVTNLVQGLATDCDGSMGHCALFFTSNGTPFYFLGGVATGAPAGNHFACSQDTDAGVYCFASDNTNNANLTFAPSSGNSGLTLLYGGKNGGVDLNGIDRTVEIGRMAFGSGYTTTITSGAFSLGAGWGSTASVTGQGGTDNNFDFTITTGGSGIAANPTVVYTYVDGDFSTPSSSTPNYVCVQTGGNDVISDVTRTVTQTTVTMTWHSTPTTGKTYEIGCVGFQRN